MRRKDREMSPEFGRTIIDRAVYATLALVDDRGRPYAIPVSPVRIRDKIYIHSAQAGEKVELLQDNTAYQMVFVGKVEVPELYTKSELEEMLVNPTKAVDLVRTVFTTEYESAIAKGKLCRVIDEDERRQALLAIAQKYCPSKAHLMERAVEIGGPRTFIYSFSITELTAKRKKYDTHGNEMKWGRQ